MVNGKGGPSVVVSEKKSSSRRRQGHKSPHPAVSFSALDQVPPIAQLHKNSWTHLPVHFTTPLYLGTLSTTTSGSNIIPNTISSPIARLGDHHLAAGTIGGDVVLWDLHPVAKTPSMTTQQEDRRSLHMPIAVFQPPCTEVRCRVIQLLTSPAEAHCQHDDEPLEITGTGTNQATATTVEVTAPTLWALCATGLVHTISWKSHEKKNRITNSWWSPHPISKGAILDSQNTLVLAHHMTIHAYSTSPTLTSAPSSPSSEPTLLWTLRSDSVVQDIVPLGEHLLVLVLAGGTVKVVDVRSIARTSPTATAHVKNHAVLATPGREIVVPSHNLYRGEVGGPTTSLSHRLSSTRSVVCWNTTLVVVLEIISTAEDDDCKPASWGVATDDWDEIQLPYGCAGLGSLGESNLVSCLTAGTTYVWDREGSCRSFVLPVREPYDSVGMGLESFMCCSMVREGATTAPLFVYQWPMNVIDIFGLAVDDSPLVEALIENGIAGDLRALVLAQPQDTLSDRLWLAAYHELASIDTLTLRVVQAMPAFRSLLISLTSRL